MHHHLPSICPTNTNKKKNKITILPTLYECFGFNVPIDRKLTFYPGTFLEYVLTTKNLLCANAHGVFFICFTKIKEKLNHHVIHNSATWTFHSSNIWSK